MVVAVDTILVSTKHWYGSNKAVGNADNITMMIMGIFSTFDLTIV